MPVPRQAVAAHCRFAEVAEAVIRLVELIVQPDASGDRLRLPLPAPAEQTYAAKADQYHYRTGG
jgi:hypothetical protein